MRAERFQIPQLRDRKKIAEWIAAHEERKTRWDGNGENILPNEIWNLIFSKLRAADLKNVTLVCTKFSEIINNSLELMEKFWIILEETANPHLFRQVMANSSRKYQNFSVDNLNQDHSFDLEFFKINPIKIFSVSGTCSKDILLKIWEATHGTL